MEENKEKDDDILKLIKNYKNKQNSRQTVTETSQEKQASSN